jgi:methyl-accepting chemotaxis protein
MLLTNLKISRKLFVAFGTMVVGLIISLGLVFMSLQSVDESRQVNRHTQDVLGEMFVFTQSMLYQQLAIRGFVLSADPEYLPPYQKARTEFEASAARLQSLIAVPVVKEKFLRLVDTMVAWHGFVDRLVPLINNPDTRKQAEESARPQRETVSAAVVAAGEMWTEERKVMEERGRQAEAASADARRMLLIASAAAVLLATASLWLLTRAIARPVAAMTVAMQRLAQGDSSVEVPAIGRRDEIGAMAAAVQAFKDAAIAQKRLETEAEEARRISLAERAEAEAQREAAASHLATVVERLADGLTQLAEGNLTFALHSEFAPEYERLRADYNAALTGLQAAMQDLMTHSQAIGSGTSEIAHATDDLARRTEQQAASLEQTAAALDEITATVRQTATGSAHAQSLAAAANSEAESSGAVVGEAVAAMSEIEGSARQIGQIIGVIDEIAFQTNLLALNAGVEAARAGEAGKGFAVVASEVRALAQRAADAAKEIKTLISTSIQQVERGVRLVGETGAALGRIQTSVSEIHRSINEIAASAREQSNGLAEVNSAINQMDQTTQQNAAMVEQSTAAAHSLARETEEMARAMQRFRITGEPPPARLAHRGSPVRPAVQGNNALKPLADTADWDSF